MAKIIGSNAIDWSTVSLGQVDFATHIAQATSRSHQIGAELNGGQWTLVSAKPTKIVVNLNSGGQVAISGSGFGTRAQIVNVVNFFNFGTGELLRFTGHEDIIGHSFFTSLTFGSTNFSEAFVGHVRSFDGNPNTTTDDTYAGRVKSLTAMIGTAMVTFSGSFTLTGDDVSAALTGTVTGIMVTSGADSIKMTGLSVDVDVIEAALTANTLSTVNDLFSFIGDHLPGNDTIVYTNNSGAGMSFSGGAGDDRITVLGSNGDTLNGGTGNDMLNGGAGDDTLVGGDGNDVFVIGDAADHGVGEVITGGDGIGGDVIRFTSKTAGQTLVLAPGVEEVERVEIGTASGKATGTIALNVDASAVQFNGLDITGNAGANRLTGTAFADVLTGNAGNDELEGQDGSDILNGGAGRDDLEGGDGNDTLIGGAGNDTMTGGLGDDEYIIGQGIDVLTEQLNEGQDVVESPFSYTLGANFEGLRLTGRRAINGTGNELANSLSGNSAANILSGREGNDVLNGGAGKDQLFGGSGDDTYHINLGDGDDLIEDSDGAADQLEFNAGISAADLVISQNADNLRVINRQSEDSVTILNWYASSNNQIETIRSGDGLVLLNTQVDQLIQAMAQFTTDTGLSWSAAARGAGTTQEQADYQAIIAANWQ